MAMNGFRAVCVLLTLGWLLVASSAIAQGPPPPTAAMLGQAPETPLVPCATAQCGDCQASCCMGSGFFAGIGGSYNSVRVDSVLSGSGVTDIYSGAQLVAIGVAGGPAAPIRQTDTTFAPVVQAGYFQNLGNSRFLWGAKFSYKYLGLTLTETNIDAPQVGTYEELASQTTSPLTGNAFTDSAQTTIDNQLLLLPLAGFDYSRGRVYFGGGPVIFDTKSRLYGLSSYADINGVHTNVGGQPLNLNASKWLWGGAWQMGLMHYLGPSCYLDVSYDFMVTGVNRFDWYVPVTNESGGLTYVTGIHYREELRIWAQSLNVTLNLAF